MLKIFIERPVLSTVISVLIVLLGLLGLYALPIAQYPDISPPTVQVSASYSGASADVVQKSVIVPLEEQINGVEGMTYMTSSATNQGGATIQVYFKVGTNGDQAAVNVQNRVASATSVLPQEVTQAGVQVRKRQTSNLITASIYSDNPAYDQTFLQNYAEINVIPQLKRVNGVGDATASGQRTYSMRIWLKPDVMANYGLTPSDISTALNQQSVEAAPGSFGENGGQSFQYIIRYSGKLKSPEAFGNIILRDQAQGQILRLKDVARIELGAQAYNTRVTVNGKPSVSVSVNQVAGSNASQVIKDAKAALALSAKDFPAGVHYTLLVDINKFLDASIDKVIHTLLECFALVFLVIFIFLQDFRSTIIHGVSVPVSILGTFFFLYVFNFSINLLTLFALVLAIGIVVDDAIVVVEAVHAKLESGYTSPRRAAIDAMSEISGAIVSITLVMAAVFLPVTFISGSTGVFYKQFGITLAVAILISAINALTLCPALAAMFLKPPLHQKGEGQDGAPTEQPPRESAFKDGKKPSFMERFSIAFNAGYDALVAKYTAVIGFLTARKWVALLAVGLFGGSLFWLMKTTPSSFVPSEDMGTIFVNITLPPAASLERSAEIADQVDSLARSIPQVANALRTVGQNSLAGQGSSYAQEIMALKNWDDRKGVTNEDVIAQMKKKTANIRDAKLVFTSLPTISGFGLNGGFEFQLQDRGAHSTEEFYKVAQNFLAELQKRPEIQYATTSFNPTFPQYLMTVNSVKCAEAGVPVSSVLAVMQGYYGSLYASNFNEFGKQYRVVIQADTNYRASIAGLSKVQVRTGSNVMAPITEFVNLERVYGPESMSRFNLYSSMAVQGSPNEGYSTGQALTAIEETATQHLPPGYSYEFSGLSREEKNSGSQATYVFALCLVFVYLLLSAQYESYILPFAVLLSLPVGLTGVYVFAKLFGIDNNIYLQISVIMLIGLLSKNAILIVEFAAERRLTGMSIVDAALEGAKARLRPILMTSFAFIFGLMPLLFASGAGANGNRSIGAGAIGGMLFGTLLGVFIIPVLYMIFEGLQERISGSPREKQEQIKREEEEDPKAASTEKNPAGAPAAVAG
jgi:HAE1 family hydrophobic/amphiphilic exporter-1